MCSVSRNLFRFWEISDSISETVQDRDIVAMEYYWMTLLAVPLNDLEGHFCCLNSNSRTSWLTNCGIAEFLVITLLETIYSWLPSWWDGWKDWVLLVHYHSVIETLWAQDLLPVLIETWNFFCNLQIKSYRQYCSITVHNTCWELDYF